MFNMSSERRSDIYLRHVGNLCPAPRWRVTGSELIIKQYETKRSPQITWCGVSLRTASRIGSIYYLLFDIVSFIVTTGRDM